jgi:hypothetical protein
MQQNLSGQGDNCDAVSTALVYIFALNILTQRSTSKVKFIIID